MITTKIVLGKPRTNGNALLRIRLYKKGESPRYHKLNKHIAPNQLYYNEKKRKHFVRGSSNDKEINLLISKKLNDIESFHLKKEIKGEAYALSELISFLDGEQTECFFQFSENYLPTLKKKQYGTWRRLRSNVKKFKDFLGKNRITFKEITPELLKKYNNHLYKHLGNKESTRRNSIKGIQIIFNQASEIHKIKDDPIAIALKKLKLKDKGKLRVPLTLAEIERIKNLVLEPWSLIWHVRNFFVSLIYTGMAISDLLTLEWSMIMDGYIFKNRRKSEEELGIFLTDYTKGIFAFYKRDGVYAKCGGNKYVFGIINEDKKDDNLAIEIVNKTALFNKYIKNIKTQAGIDRHITSHHGRHAGCCLVAQDGGVIAAQKFLGHASSRTTEKYYLRGIPQSFVDDAVKKAFT